VFDSKKVNCRWTLVQANPPTLLMRGLACLPRIKESWSSTQPLVNVERLRFDWGGQSGSVHLALVFTCGYLRHDFILRCTSVSRKVIHMCSSAACLCKLIDSFGVYTQPQEWNLCTPSNIKCDLQAQLHIARSPAWVIPQAEPQTLSRAMT
jgi:hypothetical protein